MMALGAVAAHTLCAALVGADVLARAVRLRVLNRALGHPLRLRDAFTTNALGDAACAITPMRIGGEPARLAGLLRAGVPATASFVAIGFEVVTGWPVIILSAAAIAFWFAPGWLDNTAPALLEGLAELWGWLALAGAVSLLLWIVVRRAVRFTPRLTRRPWRRVRVYWRRMPPGPLVVAAVCAFVNLAARTAILPVLMATLPDPPPLGPAVLGSFALLYSQLALPTPSGAGVVDVGLLAGAAGGLGGSGVELLLWWRFYTTFVGVILGGWLAVREFGWGALRSAFKGKGMGKSTVA